MTGLLRKAALLGACGLVSVGTALAGVPDPSQSSLTSSLGTVNNIPVSYLRGDGVTPAPGASPTEGANPGPTQRTITVRDFSGNPISGALVKVSFGDCCDVELCSASGQAGVSNDIVGHIVSGFSNAGGQFTFIVVGAAQNVKSNTLPAGYQDGCVPFTGAFPSAAKTTRVFANVGAGDVLIKQATSYVYNADGSANGGLGPSGGGATVSAGDAGRVLNDALSLGGANPRGRDDFNHNGLVTAGDAGLLLNEVLNGGGSAVAVCGAGTVGNRVATCP